MTKQEYLHAVGEAKRIFASVYICDESPRQLRISKPAARALAATLADDAIIRAIWLDPDDQTFLAVG